MSNYIAASKEFHLALIAGPEDQVSVSWDGNLGYQTADEALAATKEMVDDDGGEYMIYRCIPYKRVRRGNTQVSAFKPR